MGLVNVGEKYFDDDSGIIAPIGAGLLYALSDNVNYLPLLDYYAGKIHYVRVFAGRLTPSSSRSGQTPEHARERLPNLLSQIRQRGLRAEISCCTDTKEPYDERGHCEALSKICDQNSDIVIGMEVWNEIGHPTQRNIGYNELVGLKDTILKAGYDGPITLGASDIDELAVETGKYPSAWTGSNAYAAMHLNRGKKPSYREAFRVKEFHDVRKVHNCGACNDEPSRFDDPAFNESDGFGAERFAYLLGCLGMAFGFMTTAHGSNMRDCKSLEGTEKRAFEAFLRGANKIPREKYEWFNANNTGGWGSSPVKSGAFMEGPSNSNDKALWRAYSYVGPKNFVIASGDNPAKFNLEYQNNWHPVGLIDEAFKVQIIEIKRS